MFETEEAKELSQAYNFKKKTKKQKKGEFRNYEMFKKGDFV